MSAIQAGDLLVNDRGSRFFAINNGQDVVGICGGIYPTATVPGLRHAHDTLDAAHAFAPDLTGLRVAYVAQLDATMCWERHPEEYVCTRRAGHAGRHVAALVDRTVVAVWSAA